MSIRLEKARKYMYDMIDKYGLSSKEALKASQELDLLVSEEQAKLFENFNAAC